MNRRISPLLFGALALLNLLLAPLLSACHEVQSPYPVTTSSLLYGREIGGRPIDWIDNDRVIIPGYEVDDVKQPDGSVGKSISPPGVYIWDTKTNTYTRHSNLEAPSWFFCYDHGLIVYSIAGGQQAGSQRTIMAGPLGQERQLPAEIYWPKNPEVQNCRPRPWKSVTNTNPKELIFNLRPGDGYIWIGRENGTSLAVNIDNQNQQVKLVRLNGATEVQLPILVKEMDYLAVLDYSDFSHKYILLPSFCRSCDLMAPLGWPASIPIPIYIISSDGKVETIDIPLGQPRPARVQLTRKGLLITSNETHGNSADAGGWLLQDGKMIRLFNQLVDGAGASPDGCKIAFQTNDFDPKTLDYLKVMNLCEDKQGG